jgi:hypothetical protein
MKGLTPWQWPGNIRELEKFIERALILTRGKSVEAPLTGFRRSNTQEPAVTMRGSGKEDIVRIVKETLHVLNGNKTVSDQRAQKQREEIVSTRRKQGSRWRYRGCCRAHGCQSDHASVTHEEIRHRPAQSVLTLLSSRSLPPGFAMNFFRTEKGQKYCSAEGGDAERREARLKWWNETARIKDQKG